MSPPTFPGLRLEIKKSDRIGLLELARPSKSNAFSKSMWADFAQVQHCRSTCDLAAWTQSKILLAFKVLLLGKVKMEKTEESRKICRHYAG